MTIILQLTIEDEEHYTEELNEMINQSLSECLINWNLEECSQKNTYIKKRVI